MINYDHTDLTMLVVRYVFKNRIGRRTVLAVILGIALLSSASFPVLITLAAVCAALEYWALRKGW